MVATDERAIHPLATGHPPAWASEWGEDKYGVFAGFSVGEVTQRMRWIPPGAFLMGSPKDEEGRETSGCDETQHEAWFLKGFWLADTACSQALWEAALGTNSNLSRFRDRPRSGELPVENVSYTDVVERFLPELEVRVPGLEARLPTEAEWEYACRAEPIDLPLEQRVPTPFSFGETIHPEQVNYDGNNPYGDAPKGEYRGKTVRVGSLPANGWGLHEMHGNVWEWCSDWLGDYPKGVAVNPQGPRTGTVRVIRGGSWFSLARFCRSAYRSASDPSRRYGFLGFRLSRGSG